MKEKILCIQLKQIGDVLMNTPAIKALSQNYPNHEVHFLTMPPSNQIFEFSPYVQHVHLYPKKDNVKNVFQLVRKLKAEKYKFIIDFHGVPKTALISALIGAPVRIGHQMRGRSIFYTHAVPSPNHLLYSAEKKAHLLSALQIDCSDFSLDFFTSETDDNKAKEIFTRLRTSDKRPIVSISPVSRRDYKVWPAKNFAILCDQIIEKYDAQILFLWGPGEYHFIEAVRDGMQHDDLGDYDIPTLRETVSLLKKVDLHIGNDNGPMHFANAAGVPSIAIFGKPLMENWLEPNHKYRQGIEFDPGCKRKCYYPKCELECIKRISVDSVLSIVEKVMNKA